MALVRPITLGLAVVMSSPAIYQYATTDATDLDFVLVRFLIAVPVAMVMVGGMRALTAGYRRRTLFPAMARDDTQAHDGGGAAAGGTPPAR